MAEAIYTVIGTLDSIPGEARDYVIAVCLIVIATIFALCFDAVLCFFRWLFSHLG